MNTPRKAYLLLLNWSVVGAIITATSISQPSFAQVYKWKDAEGRTVFSDSAPDSGNAKQVSKAPLPPVSKSVAPSEKKDSPGTPSKEETAKLEKAAQEKQRAQAEYCAAARKRLAQLESGVRIAEIGTDGERSFMSDLQRSDEVNRARAGMIQQGCP